jgi:hypothetical protein
MIQGYKITLGILCIMNMNASIVEEHLNLKRNLN